MNKHRIVPVISLFFLFTAAFLPALSSSRDIRQNRSGFPGTEVHYSFSINNTSDSPAAYTISLSGLPAGFDSSFVSDNGTNSEVAVGAQDLKDVELTVGIPAAAEPGRYPFDVIFSENGSNLLLSENLIIKPENIIEIITADGMPASPPGKVLELPVSFRNAGSRQLENIDITVEPPYGWDVALPDNNKITLKPGESFSTVLKAAVPRKQPAGKKTITVSVSANDVQPVTADLSVEIKQPVRILWIFSAIFAAGVLVLLIINRKYGRR